MKLAGNGPLALTGFLWLALALGQGTPVRAHDGIHEQIEAATRRIEREPRNGELYLARGELYRIHGDWASAAADYDRAAALAPDLAAVVFARGRMLYESKREREAKRELDRFLALEPGHAEALVTRARVLVALGDANAAASDFTRAIAALSTADPDLYVERARAVASLGRERADEAIAGLDEGIARLGPLVTLELCAVDVELARDGYDAALARLDRLASRAARKETWLARRGEILERAGRAAEARDAYRAALEAIAALTPFRRTKAIVALEADLRARLSRDAGGE